MFSPLRSVRFSSQRPMHNLTCHRRTLSSSMRLQSIDRLQASFRDPSSPFYLAPGTQGPSAPGDGFVVPEQVYTLSTTREVHSSSFTGTGSMAPGESKSNNALSPGEEGEAKLTEMGFDPLSFYEQKVVWGDLDSFRHVNNVRYVRYLESARMHWLQSIGQELGGQERVRDMVAGKGISLILGEISVRFRRPVTYPDTLLIAHRPHDPFPTHFKCAAAVWSNAQRTVVATSDSKLVWYDYDHLKKCDPGAETHAVLARRMRNVD